MRLLFLLCILLPINSCAHRQQRVDTGISNSELIGIWQADNNDEGSGWSDVYRFFNDGKFIFNPSQYDGLKRIIAINGTYRIKDNILYLNITSTTEMFGGNIVRSTLTTLSDSLEISGGRINEVKYPDREEELIEIQDYLVIEIKKTFIVLDNRRYFKMRNDPTEY
jgi:hypothetical protein